MNRWIHGEGSSIQSVRLEALTLKPKQPPVISLAELEAGAVALCNLTNGSFLGGWGNEAYS